MEGASSRRTTARSPSGTACKGRSTTPSWTASSWSSRPASRSTRRSAPGPSGEMKHAIDHWRKQFRGEAPVKDDADVTDADIAAHNLVLWGDPSSNKVLAKIADKLPIRWDGDKVVVGADSYPAADHVPLLIYPNPLNPKRYVVLNSGFTFREYDYLNNARQIPKLPDYAVIDVRHAAVVAAAGGGRRRPGSSTSSGNCRRTGGSEPTTEHTEDTEKDKTNPLSSCLPCVPWLSSTPAPPSAGNSTVSDSAPPACRRPSPSPPAGSPAGRTRPPASTSDGASRSWSARWSSRPTC